MGHPVGHQQVHPSAYTWAQIIEEVLAARGWLMVDLAEHLCEGESVDSARKGLYRLGSLRGDGGKWGRRLRKLAPNPRSAELIGRLVGQYHGPAADLPASARAQQIAALERPPLIELPAGGWVHIARASLSIQGERWAEAVGHLNRVAPRGSSVAMRLEWASVRAFVGRRRATPERVGRWLRDMDSLLQSGAADLNRQDSACYRARLVDQRAYELMKPLSGVPDLESAEALYLALESGDGAPTYVRLRRALGLSVTWQRMGGARLADAERQARLAVQIAGDEGAVRLRAQALAQLARCLHTAGEDSRAIRARAVAIAVRLGDENLRRRVACSLPERSGSMESEVPPARKAASFQANADGG